MFIDITFSGEEIKVLLMGTQVNNLHKYYEVYD